MTIARAITACHLVVLAGLAVGAPAGGVSPAAEAVPDSSTTLPDHPSSLAPLSLQSTFPRFTPAQLAAAGFPDHLHACRVPGWEPMQDADGVAYGPNSLVRGRERQPVRGLLVDAGSIRYRGIHLRHDVDVSEHMELPMVELLDWARRDVAALLGFDRDDTLLVYDPPTLEDYTAATGNGFWRLYAWQDGECIIEPAATMAARTLDAHAAFAIVTDWLLAGAASEGALPAWFTNGLGSYLGEYGVHLVNYMLEFRSAGIAVRSAPAWADSVLAALPAADRQTDRQSHRLANYTAFLMVWELVENRGGLTALRTLVAELAAGATPDQACRRAYGLSWVDLAATLDPRVRPEPIGDAVQARSPHILPTMSPTDSPARSQQP